MKTKLSKKVFELWSDSVLGVRNSAYIQSEFGDVHPFLAKLDQLFGKRPQLERQWLAKISSAPRVIGSLVDLIIRMDTPLPKFRGSIPSNINIDETQSLVSKRIVLLDGSEPKFLFRYVALEELEEIKLNKMLTPSKFYRKIHTSVVPEAQYGGAGSVLIAIKYNRGDGWLPKIASTGIYAITEKSIPIEEIYAV